MKEEYAYKKQKHELGQSSENVLIKANNPGGALLKWAVSRVEGRLWKSQQQKQIPCFLC